jgi:hypothetical protein
MPSVPTDLPAPDDSCTDSGQSVFVGRSILGRHTLLYTADSDAYLLSQAC